MTFFLNLVKPICIKINGTVHCTLFHVLVGNVNVVATHAYTSCMRMWAHNILAMEAILAFFGKMVKCPDP